MGIAQNLNPQTAGPGYIFLRNKNFDLLKFAIYSNFLYNIIIEGGIKLNE